MQPAPALDSHTLLVAAVIVHDEAAGRELLLQRGAGSKSRELLSIQKLSAPQRTALQQHIGVMESMLAPLGGQA